MSVVYKLVNKTLHAQLPPEHLATAKTNTIIAYSNISGAVIEPGTVSAVLCYHCTNSSSYINVWKN